MAKVILKTLSTQEDRDIAALNDAGRPRLATQQWYSDGVVFCFRLYWQIKPCVATSMHNWVGRCILHGTDLCAHAAVGWSKSANILAFPQQTCSLEQSSMDAY